MIALTTFDLDECAYSALRAGASGFLLKDARPDELLAAVRAVAAGAAVVLVLMAPSLVPQVARWVRTFPAPGAGGQSSDPVWWTVLAVCVVAIAISVGGRRLPRWMSRVP